jgi:hypothetical protein
MQEPLWTLPLSLAAVSCKSHLSKVFPHPSILKNPYKFLRFSRAKRAGGFAADLGRFGETTLPFFRLALTEQRPPSSIVW